MYLDGGAVTLDLHLLEGHRSVLVRLGVLLEHGNVAQGGAALQALEARVVLVVGEVTLGERRSAVLSGGGRGARTRGLLEGVVSCGVTWHAGLLIWWS